MRWAHPQIGAPEALGLHPTQARKEHLEEDEYLCMKHADWTWGLARQVGTWTVGADCYAGQDLLPWKNKLYGKDTHAPNPRTS
jgi:hypothetical protein